MPSPVNNHHLAVRNSLGENTSSLQRDDLVVRAVDHQRGYGHLSEAVTKVDSVESTSQPSGMLTFGTRADAPPPPSNMIGSSFWNAPVDKGLPVRWKVQPDGCEPLAVWR